MPKERVIPQLGYRNRNICKRADDRLWAGKRCNYKSYTKKYPVRWKGFWKAGVGVPVWAAVVETY